MIRFVLLLLFSGLNTVNGNVRKVLIFFIKFRRDIELITEFLENKIEISVKIDIFGKQNRNFCKNRHFWKTKSKFLQKSTFLENKIEISIKFVKKSY